MRKDTDGQTDMTKLTVTFRNFANAPTNAYSTVDGKQRLFGSVGRRSEDVQKNHKETRWKRVGGGDGSGGGGFIWLGTGTSNRLL